MFIYRRLRLCLTTWPDRRGWLECLAIAVAAVVAIAAISASGGLLTWRPDLTRLSVTVFVVPAFAEELVFRGALPARGESQRPMLWLGAGVLVFTLWHAVEALTFLPGAGLFLRPTFLLAAAGLGAACAWMRYRTGSLWPSVLFHGVVVLAWQVLFHGPTVVELRSP